MMATRQHKCHVVVRLLLVWLCGSHVMAVMGHGSAAASSKRQMDGSLVVGLPSDSPPFSYIDESGRLAGFDVSLIEAVAAQLSVQVEFVSVALADAPSLLNGEVIDVAPVWWPVVDARKLEENAGNVDYSQPYFEDSWCTMATPASANADFSDDGTAPSESEYSVVGYMAGLARGKQMADWINGTVDETQSELAARKIVPRPFREIQPGLVALTEGQIDRFVTTGAICRQFSMFDSEISSDRLYKVWGIAGADQAVRAQLNGSLQELVNRSLYSALHQQWFPKMVPYGVYRYPDKPVLSYDVLEYHQTGQSDLLGGRIKKLSLPIESDDSHTIRAGVPYHHPPFGSIDLNTEQVRVTDENHVVHPVGLDVALARTIGRVTEPPLRVELLPATAQTAIPMLKQGMLEIVIAAISPTWQKEDTVDFSRPYLRDNPGLLVSIDSKIAKPVDLSARLIGYVRGDVAAQHWAAQIRYLIESEADFEPPTYLPFQEVTTLVRALQEGEVDAVVGAAKLLDFLAGQAHDLKLVDVLETSILYSVALPRNQHQLRLAVDRVLLELEHEGELDSLYNQWFDQAGDIPNYRSGAVHRTPAEPAPAIAESAPSAESPAFADNGSDQTESEANSHLAATTTANRTYRVQAGDSLTALAIQFYGDRSQWLLLYEENRTLIGNNPSLLFVGMELKIPDVRAP